MKKTTLLFLFSFLSLSLFSQWCGNSFIVVNSLWYTGSNSYVHTGGYFNNANLGTFSAGSSFTLAGELQVWPAITSDATLWYKIDSQESFASIALPKTGDEGSNSKHYGSAIISLNGLSDGAHTITVYFQAGSAFDNNGGSNYVANFVTSVSTQTSELSNQLKLYAESGSVKVECNSPSKIELFTISGQRLDSKTVISRYQFHVLPGLYLVKINGISHKIIVD